MGYHTDFFGRVQIEPPLNAAEAQYLERFADSRRMAMKEGPYFVGEETPANVIDHNAPPEGQPGLWCQWVPVDGGAALAWNGIEKFYNAEEWMTYVIDHFLRPGAKASKVSDPQFSEFTFNHRCDGAVLASGEQFADLWRLVVANNAVSVDRYDVDQELPDEIWESGHSWSDAIFTLTSDPKAGIDQVRAFLADLGKPNKELTRYLKDLAGVLPSEHRDAMLTMLAGAKR